MTDKTTAERDAAQFTACDMATASAQGFRDGRASLPLPGAQEAVAQATQAALETLERTYQTITRQLDLIAERAPGTFLDKQPVVNTLRMHQKRAETAAIALRSALAAAPQPALSAGWRDISTAPKDGTLILVREPRCSGIAVMYLHGWKYESGGICYLEPTHWQPLPVAPSMDGESA